jgi:hypothetical protein
MQSDRQKTCYKCKQTLPVSDFGNKKTTKDGLQDACKSCCSAYFKEYHQKNKLEMRLKQQIKIRNTPNYNKENIKRWVKNNPDKMREAQNRYRLKKGKQSFAVGAVFKAIKKGEITRQPCLICQSSEVEAHHSDYNKPIDVTWLCVTHHKAWHRVFDPIRYTEIQEKLKGDK